MFAKPILLIIFNRPETTERVFNEIRKLKPRYFYVAGDGPRTNQPADQELCKKTRAIIQKVDWPCYIKTSFNEYNLGCGLGPAKAITWFFQNVNEGIILEDDCIPNLSFFKFCDLLLDKYRTNEKVMMISGTSFQPDESKKETYYFSRYPHVWGWATWKRAWCQYNYSLDGENEFRRLVVINRTFSNKRERRLWVHNFRHITNGLNAWDYQWMYWIWKNNGLCIIPWKNMISNVGFGNDATHTFDSSSIQASMNQHDIVEFNHPSTVKLHKNADKFERYKILIEPNGTYYLRRMKAGFKRILNIIR